MDVKKSTIHLKTTLSKKLKFRTDKSSLSYNAKVILNVIKKCNGYISISELKKLIRIKDNNKINKAIDELLEKKHIKESEFHKEKKEKGNHRYFAFIKFPR